MNCPNCNADLNRHVTAADRRVEPPEGDLSVCFYCGSVSVFERGNLRRTFRSDIEKLSPKEAFELGSAVASVFKRIAEDRKALAECDGV